MKKVIKKEKDEGKKFPARTVKENEGVTKIVSVTRTNLSFRDAEYLKAGEFIKHIRVMKVISITHNDDGCADVELEIIKRNWYHTSI